MSVLENCKPREVFHFFEEISKVPRESGHMEAISAYMEAFAKKRGLSYQVDEAFNVIIKKPGTKGMKRLPPVIIQGHMDMVCEKVTGSSHDFQKDGIALVLEDGFVKAKDTSLGADDGIAVAYALALLDSDTICHPPLEVVLTTEEEVGMLGALALDMTGLKGKYLINIDFDEEGVLLGGSAGGCIQTITLPVERIQKSGDVLELTLAGLRGGHSGVEIDSGRKNANKLMAEALYTLSMQLPLCLVAFQGGSKNNVITPEAKASIVVTDSKKAKEVIQNVFEDFKEAFGQAEPAMCLTIKKKGKQALAMTTESTKQVLFLLNGTPNGVQEYSTQVENLPETSLNLGIVMTMENEMLASFSIRSSVTARGRALEERLQMFAEKLEGVSEISNRYPGWRFRKQSSLRDLFVSSFEKVFDRPPLVMAIHAGLECGLLQEKRPDLDVISFGPTVYDIHSVGERMDIHSVERNWELLLHILKSWAEIGGK